MRLIDADELKKHKYHDGKACENAVAVYHIDNAPTIDLVHCRECKFWSENTQFCHMFSTRFTAQRMLPNDFCSLGVKKESE